MRPRSTSLVRTGRIAAIALAILGAIFHPTLARGQASYGPPSPPWLATAGSGAGIDLGSLPGMDAGGMSGALGGAGGMNPMSVLGNVGDALDAMSGKQGAPAGPPSPGLAGQSDSRSGSSRDGGGLSTSVNILVLLTVVSLVPSIILMCTCFVRILIVLGFVKQALGTQSIPPPQVITALAMFMTLIVMSPTLSRINEEAIGPYRRGEVRDYDEMWNRAKAPIRDFMFSQIEATGNWSSLYAVLERRGIDVSRPERLTRADVDMVSLVPAFMLSELKVAFLMGFKVYLPFLVIDMVISTMLISMSMMMLPPVLISLPFKILLFVMVDGWTLVVSSLMRSFADRGAAAALLLDAGGAHVFV